MDPRAWSLLLNTLLLGGATLAIGVPVGSALAWLLLRTDLPGRRAGVVALGLMLFVPLYLQAAAWHAGFGVQGWFHLAFDLPEWLDRWTLLDGWRATIWIHALAAVPWVALIVGLGLLSSEPELEEQALLDGSAWQVFWRVTLRGAAGALGVALLWVAIVVAGEMTVAELFQVRTFAEELFTRLALGETPGEAVLGMGPGLGFSAILAVAVLVVCARAMPRWRPVSLRRRWVFRLGRWRWPLGLLVALGLAVLAGVPLGNLIFKAGTVVSPTAAGWQWDWSVANCLTMMGKCLRDYRAQFGWSLGIGALAATTALIAGIALAWPARHGGWWAVPALLTTAVLFTLPGPAVGMAIVWLMNAPGWRWLYWLYDRPVPAPWLAMTLRALPLVTLVLWQALRSVPRELLDSAAADGAGTLRQVWSVALPCRRSALALAWVVGLAVSLGELGAVFPVVPPGVETLSVRVRGLMHAGQEAEVAGLCLGLVFLFAGVAAVALGLAYRWRRVSATQRAGGIRAGEWQL